jgi:hypothetical protein
MEKPKFSITHDNSDVGIVNALMKPEKTTTSSILIVLLIYVFTAGNTSGELVLCIGANWHVALEPLINGHCHISPNIEKGNPSSHEPQYSKHLESPHCKPCIDIPVFIGPTDKRLVPEPAKSNTNTLVSLAGCALHTFIPDKLCAMHTLPAVPLRSYFAIDENSFLRCIILLV